MTSHREELLQSTWSISRIWVTLVSSISPSTSASTVTKCLSTTSNLSTNSCQLMTRDLKQPNSLEMVSPDNTGWLMSTVKVSTRTHHGGLALRTGPLSSSLMSSLTTFSSTLTGIDTPSISSPPSMLSMIPLLFMAETSTTLTKAPTLLG